MVLVNEVMATPGRGLQGDRYRGSRGVREVTLIQAEHIGAIAALAGLEAIAPELLRRNVVVAGINLVALIGRRFQLGEAVLKGTGACHPCSAMEAALGAGGYNAMRGHGGITAQVLSAGMIAVGATVTALDLPDGQPNGAMQL